jgi:hypothetical protein
MLVKAKLQPRKKAILIGIFSLGIFITIIQIIRILTIKSLSDYLDSSKLIMWSMVENNLGIIVGSIPALGPLFRSILDKTSHVSSSQRHGVEHSPYSLRNIYRRKSNHAPSMGGQSSVHAIASGSGKHTTAEDPWRTEGGSDEHLNNPGSIYTRTEFTVEHEAREEGAG